jgi:hypothetical protein
MFWEVVGLERGPLSLVSTTDELHGRKSSGSGLEKTENTAVVIGRSDQATLLYPQKLTLTSQTGGRSVGIVRSRIQAIEFSYSFFV